MGDASFAILLSPEDGIIEIRNENPEFPSPHPLPIGERERVRGRIRNGGLIWSFSI
jgi:hypothetical protein